MSTKFDVNDVKADLRVHNTAYRIASLSRLPKSGLGDPGKLPFSIKILLESAVRSYDGYQITMKDIEALVRWSPKPADAAEIGFKPGRVILQDFTGVPCIVDLAAMRDGLKRLGGDYRKINPQVPCDLVIDHSVQVDAFGSKNALKINVELEFKRNKERYEFLKWGQNVFTNFRVIPPATGIVHQVNLEYLAKGVLTKKEGKELVAFPDSLVGTDSHTTMINGLGIVGWGVGGIEAEAVMLGEPIYMLIPEVIGFKLTGKMGEGVTATDLVLTVTEMLRKKGVVGKFIEFYGGGLKNLTLPDRATIANMAPEYGATIGLFPIDDITLDYYRLTGRKDAEVDLVEAYMKEQGMFYSGKGADPLFTDTLKLDLSDVCPSVAGPKRPQDRMALSALKENFNRDLVKSVNDRGFGLTPDQVNRSVDIKNGRKATITHGSVVIAAITSCTNTSNPSVLICAGLLAKRAVEKGLAVRAHVKTSFAPGSQVVEEYLRAAGLLKYLEKLKFHIVGYGCTTCIGNSGPLPEAVSGAIAEGNLIAVSVLSGNRNFEGRINPQTKANYLASPPLVVAYALAGTVKINLDTEPLGKDKSGQDVYLMDLWPSQAEINKVIGKYVSARVFRKRYKTVCRGNADWNAIKGSNSDLYDWKPESTYIQEPPFFKDMDKEAGTIQEIRSARVLVMVGDSVTTDHISPAGSFSADSPAGKYLIEQGVAPADFNSYGARRGNDRVMTRGTFANIRLRNQLAPGTEGSWTIHFPSNEKMNIYDAALRYKADKTPLMVLAGKEYGAGSSRDWAAKGTALLGVRVVIAQSYERIHRSNLAGMGVLPLEFKPGESAQSLGLTGNEVYDFEGITDNLKPRQEVTVMAKIGSGIKRFQCAARLDTPVEVDYFRNGGILPTVLRKIA
ncbi:MAG: aconitate hydratase 1 [Omnitrophica WOR_2 bacterium RIFCSPHIGHO2_02_FULL_52_10]|nr:MAG: aconitate hydratase 1 [Omnitrophica WOR_2 bacterium RIFCSPHIGHO2_02_FULL_52_10]